MDRIVFRRCSHVAFSSSPPDRASRIRAIDVASRICRNSDSECSLLFLTPGTFKNPGLATPKWTIVLLSPLTVLTVVYFIDGWADGIRYQGLRHTSAVFIMNVAWLGTLWFGVARCWHKSSFRKSTAALVSVRLVGMVRVSLLRRTALMPTKVMQLKNKRHLDKR